MSPRVKLSPEMRDIFGIRQFRPGQEQVISSVLAGHHTLAVMSTGAGKSLCYQLPALRLPGVTVVVSPLIALMKDQADKLAERGLAVAQINSALTEREQQAALDQIAKQTSEFVFTTPERLADPSFLALLKASRLDIFVIDEAHCISEWGHDFRPAFLQLKDAIRQLGNPPVLALTATATHAVIADIQRQLGLRKLNVFNLGVHRPNLHFEVRRVSNEAEKQFALVEGLRSNEGTGIIYAATIKNVMAVTEYLKQTGFAVAAYHGQLPARERRENQDRFMAGELKAMVATNAFGMGIDKPDIRFVIHYNLPGSLESYYQEAGRAGRDGEPARCVLLFQLSDKRLQSFFLGGRYPTPDEVGQIYAALCELRADEQPVRLPALQEHCSGIAQNKLRVALALLKESGIAKEVRGASFKLLQGGVNPQELADLARQYQERGETDRRKLEQMMLYGQGAGCRWRSLADYFGDELDAEQCGHCDNCLNPPQAEFASPPRSPEAALFAESASPAEAPKVQIGQAVTLPDFGEGRVTAIEGDKAVVTFADGQPRKFKQDWLSQKCLEPQPSQA